MLFEHDVFISYPHISNKDDQAGQNGWVAKFHNDLQIRLDDMLGCEARIWRDNKMRLGTVFGEAICNRLGKTKVLLCVLSPAYLQSEWCLRELSEFRRVAQQNGGLALGDQSRIITVVKTPVAGDRLGLDQSLYCKFYDTTNSGGGVPQPFSQVQNGFKYDEYERRVNEVAWAIKPIVEGLGDDTPADMSRTIYLAETSSDREGDRNKIKNELEARKVIVLPRKPLPGKTADEYVDAVRRDLQLAFMSIHMFGENYGSIPERAQGKSIVQIQNELAAERSLGDELFKRVIWIPKDLPNAEAGQAEFLTRVRSDDQALLGAEMVERSLEDLKTRLLQILFKKPPKRESDNLVRIYLICDRQDDDSVGPIGRFLFDKGYDVILPPEEQGGRVLRYHKNSLLRCDAALTIYGNAKFEWVQDRYDDVVAKVKGWGRERGISCTAILRTDPETRRKEMLFFRKTKILPPCYNGLSEETLAKPLNEFINELEEVLSLELEARNA